MDAIDEYRDSSYAYVYKYTRTSTENGYEENHETSRITRTLANNYVYGTGYTFNKTTGQFTLTDYTNSIYDGSQVGKYTCANYGSSCSILYYVESEDTITTANVKTISRTGTTYEDTHANIINSTIKGKVDEWYEEHILGTEYEAYIADTLFCNDQSISPDKPNSDYTNSGIGTEETAYRWIYDQYQTLICSNEEDSFTVSDKVTGNGDLTYPIGLINTDEIYLAGGYSRNSNSGYYLYTGNYYWTITPGYFNEGSASARFVSSDGSASNPYTV